MIDTPTTRLPPQIIRVPPPEPPRISRLLLVAATCALLAAVPAIVFAPFPANLVIGGCLAAFVALLGVLVRIQPRAQHRRRQQMLAAFPDLLSDPFTARLDRIWQEHPSKLPRPDTMWMEFSALDPPGVTPRPRIVCFGPMDIPDIGDRRFEPYIVSATAFLLRRLMFVPLAFILVLVWLLQTTHVIPGARVNLGGFIYIIVLAAVTSITWIWRGTIRPTYVRMAPGVIQVLEYGLRRRKPAIRTYPIEPGTLVLVHSIQKGLNVTLLRDGQKDVLPLAQLRNRAEAAEHFWQAVLSTAPIPPLSDEDLIG